MLKSGCFSLIIWVKQCKQGCSWKPTVFIFLIFYIKMQHLGKICQKDVYHHRNGTFVKILWTSAPIIHYNQQEASFSKHSSLNWAPGQTTATTGPSTPPHRTKWSQLCKSHRLPQLCIRSKLCYTTRADPQWYCNTKQLISQTQRRSSQPEPGWKQRLTKTGETAKDFMLQSINFQSRNVRNVEVEARK